MADSASVAGYGEWKAHLERIIEWYDEGTSAGHPVPTNIEIPPGIQNMEGVQYQKVRPLIDALLLP